MANFEEITNDIDLVAAMQTNDQHAFRQIYDRHWKSLYLRAAKNVGEDEAKDLVQEVMVSLWKRRHRISVIKEEDLSKYLFTALKYRTISFYTYASAQIKKAESLDIAFEAAPDTLMENKELGKLLDAAINNMPEKMQLIFRMSREDDMPIATIAAQLDLSEQTVKNQITQALKRLRSAVLDHQTGDWILPVVFLLYASHK
ncbi:sigma-70 family RNA polymerase sigma factor [Mucilaginibacter sp.]|uniref:RNA polymerase sigma factor n=1 Tax=Mucilaginibacter sp. TaxID=1882438 RepID=UPI0025E8AC01|nr:sigma-70 family RNA polymerase sigma factor [Mucilaginibacter sp.]